MKKSNSIQNAWIWPPAISSVLSKINRTRIIRIIKPWLGLLLPPVLLIGVAMLYRNWRDQGYTSQAQVEEVTQKVSTPPAPPAATIDTPERIAPPKESKALINAATLAASERLRSLNNSFNLFDNTSELSQLNQTAAKKPFPCSDDLWAILKEARRVYLETKGSVDISTGPLLRLWDFHTRRSTYPEPEEISAAAAKVGMDKVRFDDQARTVFFTQPGMFLDLALGDLAQNYALGQAATIIEKAGIRRNQVNLNENTSSQTLPSSVTSPAVANLRIPARNLSETSPEAPVHTPAQDGKSKGFTLFEVAVLIAIGSPLYGMLVLALYATKKQVSKAIKKPSEKSPQISETFSVSVYNSDGYYVTHGEPRELSETPKNGLQNTKSSTSGDWTNQSIYHKKTYAKTSLDL